MNPIIKHGLSEIINATRREFRVKLRARLLAAIAREPKKTFTTAELHRWFTKELGLADDANM